MKPLFVVIDGIASVFTSAEEYHAATFSPDCIIEHPHTLTIKGKSYQERRENLRNLAIDIQSADNGGLSCMETAILQWFFEKNGRKYGLLTEFRENCIC